MFESFNVTSMFITIPNILTLLASGKYTGICVDSGDGVTSVMPVYSSHTMKNAIHRINMGGDDLTQYMADLLTKRGYTHDAGGVYDEIL